MAVADKVDYVHLDKLELLYMRTKDFGIFLGQKALGQNVSGTIHLGGKGQWDNSPRVNHLWDKWYWDNPLGTIYSAPTFTLIFFTFKLKLAKSTYVQSYLNFMEVPILFPVKIKIINLSTYQIRVKSL